MTPWTLYWITRLDAIQLGFILGFVICLAPTLTLIIIQWMAEMVDERPSERFSHWIKSCVIGTIIFGLGWLITPTTKEMAAILVIPAIVNSESVQEFSGTVKDLADAWMKKQLEELKDGN